MSEMAPEQTPEDPHAAKAVTFIEAVDRAMHEVFDLDTEHPLVVIGLQFHVAGDTDVPPVILSSNLPVCVVGEALADMMEAAEQQHATYHRPDGDHPFMDLDDAVVPPDVREAGERLAEAMGLPPDAVVYRASVSTDDLSDEGLADLLHTVSEEDVPTTVQVEGPDDIATVEDEG